MNHLDELVDLTQQLVSVMDDIGRGIISTDIYPKTGRVVHLCNTDFFLQHFSIFDVSIHQGNSDYPVEIQTEIDGVSFIAILNKSELFQIKNHLPESWINLFKTPTEIIHVNFEQLKSPSALACE